MSLSNLVLCIDITTGRLYSSPSGGFTLSPSSLPLYFGDTLGLQIYLLTPLAGAVIGGAQWAIVPTTGLALELFLDNGEVDASVGAGTIYASQVAWSTDPANQYFFANLALNTASLETLLGDATSVPCWLKIGFVQNGVNTTVHSSQVTINVGLPVGDLVVPQGLTPLSQEVAATEFVPIAGAAGQGFYLISPDGTKRVYHWLDNDGVVHDDPVN
jgi:hypothetical protein